MSDRDYCYPPDYTVLRNRLDIQDPAALEVAERELVASRLLESVPAGEFDLDHPKAIHRHLFQDVYAWAGEVRTVEIAKRDSRIQPRRFIAAGMADIHRRIAAAGYFRRSGPDGFAVGAGAMLGDVNHVHPFREGNGRTQLQYLKQLAARAGHAMDLTRIDRAAWLDASLRSNAGDHAAITRCIRQALVSLLTGAGRMAAPSPSGTRHGSPARTWRYPSPGHRQGGA